MTDPTFTALIDKYGIWMVFLIWGAEKMFVPLINKMLPKFQKSKEEEAKWEREKEERAIQAQETSAKALAGLEKIVFSFERQFADFKSKQDRMADNVNVLVDRKERHEKKGGMLDAR